MTGLEKKLVLDYLSDECASVTLKFPDKNSVFPIAIKKQNFTVQENRVLVINQPLNFPDSPVHIQFYYRKLSLYFDSVLKATGNSAVFAVPIPDEIQKNEDKEAEKPQGIYATVSSAESKSGANLKIDCPSLENYPLFKKPDWSEVPQENFSDIKKFVSDAMQKKAEIEGETASIKDALYFVPICRYLFGENAEAGVESIENRFHAPKIIFADSKTLVFASKKADMMLTSGAEYAVFLHFPMNVKGPLKEREIRLSCRIESLYEDYARTKLCALAKIISVQEEDLRFLEERAG